MKQEGSALQRRQARHQGQTCVVDLVFNGCGRAGASILVGGAADIKSKHGGHADHRTQDRANDRRYCNNADSTYPRRRGLFATD
jgi:hypothetical protein